MYAATSYAQNGVIFKKHQSLSEYICTKMFSPLGHQDWEILYVDQSMFDTAYMDICQTGQSIPNTVFRNEISKFWAHI